MIHLKNQSDIDGLRAAADLVGRTLGVLAAQVKPGATTLQLDRLAETFILDHGAKPAFKGYQVGKSVFPNTLCTSVNDAVVHGIPDDRPLKDGDLVSVDCGVLLKGFYGDSAYSFVAGAVSEETAALCRVTFEALHLGIEQAIAGNRIGDIGHAVQRHCEDAGYGVVRDLVGHGIGRNLHEEPSIPNFGRQGSGRKLRDGLVICIEPMINRGRAGVRTESDGWTVRTEDGAGSAHYEHMVVVRRGAAEILTTFDYIEQELDIPPYHMVTTA